MKYMELEGCNTIILKDDCLANILFLITDSENGDNIFTTVRENELSLMPKNIVLNYHINRIIANIIFGGLLKNAVGRILNGGFEYCM